MSRLVQWCRAYQSRLKGLSNSIQKIMSQKTLIEVGNNDPDNSVINIL